MSNIETVNQIYAAFGAGNIPAILEKLDEQVEWEYGATGNIPWLQKLNGRQNVVQFFENLAAIDITVFAPKMMFENGNTVVVLLNLEATVKKTGKKINEEDEVHIWHFNAGGQVARFRHRADTLQHFNALS